MSELSIQLHYNTLMFILAYSLKGKATLPTHTVWISIDRARNCSTPLFTTYNLTTKLDKPDRLCTRQLIWDIKDWEEKNTDTLPFTFVVGEAGESIANEPSAEQTFLDIDTASRSVNPESDDEDLRIKVPDTTIGALSSVTDITPLDTPRLVSCRFGYRHRVQIGTPRVKRRQS